MRECQGRFMRDMLYKLVCWLIMSMVSLSPRVAAGGLSLRHSSGRPHLTVTPSRDGSAQSRSMTRSSYSHWRSQTTKTQPAGRSSVNDNHVRKNVSVRNEFLPADVGVDTPVQTKIFSSEGQTFKEEFKVRESDHLEEKTERNNE